MLKYLWFLTGQSADLENYILQFLNTKLVLQEIIAIKTRTANYKLRQLNKTGVGDEVIKNCTLTESEMVLAEAINPGQKYNCTVSI